VTDGELYDRKEFKVTVDPRRKRSTGDDSHKFTPDIIPRNYTFNYDLYFPNAKLSTREMREISGMAWYGDNQFMCIQKEEGLVYVLDMDKDEVVERYKIPSTGINMGIAALNSQAFVVKDDGVIYGKIHLDSKDIKTVRRYTYLPQNCNVTGMAFDEKNYRFLILTNAYIKDGKDDKVHKAIYEIHPERVRDSAVLAYGLDVRKLKQLQGNQNSSVAFGNFNRPDPRLKKSEFKPTAIAVHPITNNIYLLSSHMNNNQLVVLHPKDGALLHLQDLDVKIFNKAQGMTFDPKGNLYISSVDKYTLYIPEIFRFDYFGPAEFEEEEE